MNNDSEKQKAIEIIASIKEFLREIELELGLATQDDTHFEILTESELMDIFGVSRTTLYRARKNGGLPFMQSTTGGVEYNYSAVLLALKTNRFRVPNTAKSEAIEKLKDYHNLKMLSDVEGF